MSPDLRSLLRRDHRDLEAGLDELVRAVSLAQIRTTLDGVRLGLTAHAEAEDLVLHAALTELGPDPVLEAMLAKVRAGHAVEERALAALVCAPLGTATWRDLVGRLRELVHEHAGYEERHVLPAIHELVPLQVYDRLPGAFATERLRQLAMLQPSAPIYVPELARAS